MAIYDGPLPGQSKYSLREKTYGAWSRHWPLLPVQTIGGRRVWCSWIYKRSVHYWKSYTRGYENGFYLAETAEYADDFDLLKTAE